MLDNKFSLFLSLLIHGESPEGIKLWSERAKRLHENRKFQEEVNAGLFEINGEQRHKLNFNQFSDIYESIFRGLYYDIFNEVYPLNQKFELFFREKLGPEEYKFLTYLDKGIVGREQFVYGLSRTEENAVGGIIGFYGRFYVVGLALLPNHLRNSNNQI